MSNGNLYVPTSGGDTDTSNANGGSILGNIKGLAQTLDYFVSSFTTLLSNAISHIQQLISAGSGFMGAMANLFTWLPSPVSSVITSALVIMIVIGVFKMLL